MAVKKSASSTTEQRCTMCGEIKDSTKGFYKSYSEMFKGNNERMCLCKECVLKLFNKYKTIYGNEIKAIYEMCKRLDVYFSKALYETSLAQSEKQNSEVCSIYFQKSNSLPQYRQKTFVDSDNITEEEMILKNDVITDEIVLFWGKGFSEEEYIFLENEYDTLCSRYESDSYSSEVLFQEIACQRLDIKKKRQMGISVDKELKTLQDLLGSANIKPVQETGANATEQATFGTLIKKWENEKPVPEPIEEWEKDDWIKKYVVVWFLGHLCKMMNVKNKFSDMYDEEINKYTVNMDEEQLEDEMSESDFDSTKEGE